MGKKTPDVVTLKAGLLFTQSCLQMLEYFTSLLESRNRLGCITLQENMVDGTKDDLTMILCLRTGSNLGINSYALKHGI